MPAYGSGIYGDGAYGIGELAASTNRALLDAALKIAGADLSNRVQGVALNLSRDLFDTSAIGDVGHTFVTGLPAAKLTVNFWQDFDVDEVDQTLLPIFQGGAPVSFELAAFGPVVSTTNPCYSGMALPFDYAPAGGKVGDGLQSPASFVLSGSISSSTTMAW